MHRLRMSVRENVLSDPNAVRLEHYGAILANGGRGWVWDEGGAIRGFAIVDTRNENVWALFVAPGAEGRGIGSRLHDAMLAWYFSTGATRLWLSTGGGTRAERLYRRAGWRQAGVEANGDLRFEVGAGEWQNLAMGNHSAGA